MLRSHLALVSLASMLVFSNACSGNAGGADTTQETAGGGGKASTSGTTKAASSTTGAAQTTAAGTGPGSGAGGAAAACDPPADAGSIFEFSAQAFGTSDIVSICAYRGDVMFIVNTAANCGYTPQYTQLEVLNDNYKDQGLRLLGFLSNDFGMQAGTEEEIEACNAKYGVTFDQFDIIGVKIGADQHPLFQWLTTRPGLEGDVTWNFNKWLVAKDGSLVARWTEQTVPNDPEVVAAIEAELAKP